MAILCSGGVGDINVYLVMICVPKYLPELKLQFFLRRLPIAVDLLVLKRQWKTFILWSVLALLILLVRIYIFKKYIYKKIQFNLNLHEK